MCRSWDEEVLGEDAHRYRLSVDLKKLRFSSRSMQERLRADPAGLVGSLSISYLTQPVFQSNEVFHAVDFRLGPNDELKIVDGYCSFRFEQPLSWRSFYRILTEGDDEDEEGQALAIYVRAKDELDGKCKTVGIAHLRIGDILPLVVSNVRQNGDYEYSLFEKVVPISVLSDRAIVARLMVGIAVDCILDHPIAPALPNVMSAPMKCDDAHTLEAAIQRYHTDPCAKHHPRDAENQEPQPAAQPPETSSLVKQVGELTKLVAALVQEKKAMEADIDALRKTCGELKVQYSALEKKLNQQPAIVHHGPVPSRLQQRSRRCYLDDEDDDDLLDEDVAPPHQSRGLKKREQESWSPLSSRSRQLLEYYIKR